MPHVQTGSGGRWQKKLVILFGDLEVPWPERGELSLDLCLIGTVEVIGAVMPSEGGAGPRREGRLQPQPWACPLLPLLPIHPAALPKCVRDRVRFQCPSCFPALCVCVCPCIFEAWLRSCGGFSLGCSAQAVHGPGHAHCPGFPGTRRGSPAALWSVAPGVALGTESWAGGGHRPGQHPLSSSPPLGLRGVLSAGLSFEPVSQALETGGPPESMWACLGSPGRLQDSPSIQSKRLASTSPQGFSSQPAQWGVRTSCLRVGVSQEQRLRREVVTASPSKDLGGCSVFPLGGGLRGTVCQMPPPRKAQSRGGGLLAGQSWPSLASFLELRPFWTVSPHSPPSRSLPPRQPLGPGVGRVCPL